MTGLTILETIQHTGNYGLVVFGGILAILALWAAYLVYESAMRLQYVSDNLTEDKIKDLSLPTNMQHHLEKDIRRRKRTVIAFVLLAITMVSTTLIIHYTTHETRYIVQLDETCFYTEFENTYSIIKTYSDGTLMVREK